MTGADENTTSATHVVDVSGLRRTILSGPKSAQNSGHTVQVQKQCIKEVPVRSVAVLENSSQAQSATISAAVRFDQLPPDARTLLKNRLAGLPPQRRVEVLAEWSARCATGVVRNAVAYLYGLIRRVLEGEFKLWAGRGEQAGQAPTSSSSTASAPAKPMPPTAASVPISSSPAPSAPPAPAAVPTSTKADPQRVRAYLDSMRAMLKPSSQTVSANVITRRGLHGGPADAAG